MAAAPEFPLIGRDDDVALLLTARREATESGPRFVLVLGDAGTGKSRLVDELAARAPETDVVVARALEYASAPYAPFDALWRQLDLREPTVLGKRPALGRALAGLGPRGAPAEGPVDPDAVKRAAFDAAIEALRFYGARRLFTLVIEDVHWSDLASLELIHHLALVAHDAPVLFIVTARENGLDEPRAKMLERIVRLPRVTTLRVDVLEPAAAAALVEEELRRARRPLRSIADRNAILDSAGGNPLYLRELARHYASRGAAGDALPGSLTASVRVRLRELAPDVQSIVRAAAVLVEFDEEQLARVTGVPVGETSAALRVALDRGLIAPPSDAWRGMTFRHELIRRTVYEDALPAERRRLHRAMVAYLDAEPYDDPDFSRRALHAFSGGDRAGAAELCEKAGDAASARHAFADAAELYHRAVEAGGTNVVDKEAQALERAGRPVAALPLLRRRLEMPGDDARTRAGILLRIARAEVRAARRDAALDAIARARALLGGVSPGPEHYGVYVFQAWLAAAEMDAPATLAALAAAEPYRELGDTQSVMRAYEAAAIAHGITRDLERWRASYEGMVATVEASGDVVRTIGAIANFSNSAFGLGETELALALDDRALRLAERSRRAELVPYAFASAAWTALFVGDLARARRLVEQVLPYCGDFPASELIAASVGVVVAVRTADDALLIRCYRERLFDDALRSGAPWQVLTVLPAVTERHAAEGRPDRARAAVASVASRLTSLKGVPEIAIQIAAFGLEPEYRSLTRWLEDEVAERPNTIGFLHLFRAIVARSGSERERYARLAVDAFRAVAYRLWEAAALERAGDLDAARAVYAACGATRDCARLSAQRGANAGAAHGLTKRETQIAELASQGLSNREIGDQLSLSDRTVEHHLSAVFAKVGVRSRVELAARKSQRTF